MLIRNENESDIEDITNIHDQAFNGPDEGKIVKDLRKNNNLTISLIAEVNKKIVGHIAYSPIYNKNEEIIGIGLAPVAVLPAYQKQGVGSNLINKGNEMALLKGFKKIFVLGDPEYYCRFGFESAKNYNYFSDFDPEGKHFMILGKQLERESEKTFVNYCKEFKT
ncbi:MAG: GNAT family N-acetyltransferase [bacterium]